MKRIILSSFATCIALGLATSVQEISSAQDAPDATEGITQDLSLTAPAPNQTAQPTNVKPSIFEEREPEGIDIVDQPLPPSPQYPSNPSQ